MQQVSKLTRALTNEAIKDLINGYIRQHENITSISIPIYINRYVLYFYIIIGDYFEKAGDNLCIKDDKISLERSEHAKTYWQLNNGYTKNWIQSTAKEIVTWNFGFKGYGEFDVKFTLTSNDDCINSQILHKKDPYHQKLDVYGIGGGCKVDIKLDTIKGKIHLSRSDFTDIIERKIYIANNIKYKLAVAINQNGAIVVLENCIIQNNIS